MKAKCKKRRWTPNAIDALGMLNVIAGISVIIAMS